MFNDNEKLVFSTEFGRICPGCQKPIDNCICKELAGNKVAPNDGIVRVMRQTKGRKGKGVTIIEGAPVTKAELKHLGRELKAKCGCGGTVKNNTIELQGDCRDKAVEELAKKGWTVKKAGG